MLTLYEFINHSNGTYTCVKPTLETNAKILEYVNKYELQKYGTCLPAHEYHTTIVYSKVPVPSLEELSPEFPIKAQFKNFSLFGEEKDVLVAELHCSELQNLFNLSIKRGATSDWPDYKPHLTLVEDVHTAVNLRSLPLIDFDIVYDLYEVAPLKVKS